MKTRLGDPGIKLGRIMRYHVLDPLHFFQLRRVTIPYRGNFIISPGKVIES